MVGGGLVEFVFRLGIAWILARALGADGYGLYTLVVSVAALTVGLGGLGLDDAMVRYLAIQTRRGDRAGMRGTMQVGIVVSLGVGVLVGIGLYAFSGWLAVGVFDEPALLPLIRIVSGVVPFLLLSNVLLGVTRGFNRMDLATFAENVVRSGVRFSLLAVLWFLELDVVAAVIAFGLADVSATVVFIFFVRRLVRAAGPPVPPRHEYAEIFGFALPLWLSGLLNRFRRNLETFVLGVLSIAADVGVFTVAARVNFISHTVYRAVIVAVKPILAQAFADGDRATLARTYSSTTRWTFTMNLPFLLVTVLYAEDILGVFGPEFVDGASAFVVLAFSELFIAFTGTCGSMIDMAGHTRVKLVNSVLWVASALGLSILLIPPFGVIGAAVASMASVTLVNLVRTLEVWILDRLQPWRRDFWKPAAAAIAAGAWGYSLRLIFEGHSIWSVVLQGIPVVLAYVGVLAMLGFHDDDRVILGRIRDKLTRRARGRVS
jgi:O-antigen/teichoic acid export membrane protein